MLYRTKIDDIVMHIRCTDVSDTVFLDARLLDDVLGDIIPKALSRNINLNRGGRKGGFGIFYTADF